MLRGILRPLYKPIVQAYEKRKNSRTFVLRRLPKGSVCAEIGVFQGEFSQQILDKTRPRKLHLIDPWRYQPGPDYSASWYGGDSHDQRFMDAVYEEVCRRFQPQITSEVVQIHRKPSAEAAADFPENHFDWIYVDGDHHYEAVLQDLSAYRPKVKPGGYVAGDDYGSGGWWKGGVKRAVDELISSGAFEPVLIKNSQFILRRR
jgi:SAM-dependent methyltransferase